MDVKKASKQRGWLTIRLALVIQIIVSCGFIAVIGFFRPFSLVVTVPLLIFIQGGAVWIAIRYNTIQKNVFYRLYVELCKNMKRPPNSFPMPTLACLDDGTILWYNQAFSKEILKGVNLIGSSFDELSSKAKTDFCKEGGSQIFFKDRYYHVYAAAVDSNEYYIFYFEENTELVKTAKEYKLSRPVVILVTIDNYEELFDGKKESEKSVVLGAVDRELERFVGQSTGFLRRLSQDRFLIVLEKRHLDKIIENRFPILDSVRKISVGDRNPATLSIGVGSDAKTLGESEAFAKQALDMALGRGGDQAAVKTENGYDFYGGVSKGIEKRTKVKSRVIAVALRELIENSDKTIVMGHRFGDLDSVGSAMALTSAIRNIGKSCFMVADYNKTLAIDLLDRAKEAGLGEMILYPEDALQIITDKTLLIVVDTHNPDFVESASIYKKAKNIVVIDHHRKMVRYIDNAVIFYHEPYASSASEMITELIQYLGECKIGSVEAEALLSGIMLDTKNFVIKTGVRTFEAAAYLRRLGADTVSVRKLFSSTIENYQQKTRIVSSAEAYKGCAIAIGDFQSDDMRIIAPQAADELLNISGVSASFVIYMTNSTANVSARSLGEINAQVIMEALGGGGHQTMAAAQLEDTGIEKAKQLLLEAIDNYFNDSNPIVKK